MKLYDHIHVIISICSLSFISHICCIGSKRRRTSIIKSWTGYFLKVLLQIYNNQWINNKMKLKTKSSNNYINMVLLLLLHRIFIWKKFLLVYTIIWYILILLIAFCVWSNMFEWIGNTVTYSTVLLFLFLLAPVE
jgi:hypothetical protein